MKHFPDGKYEAQLRCMKRDPKGSHVFLPGNWAKKIPAAKGVELEDFSRKCKGFSCEANENTKTIIDLLAAYFPLLQRKRQRISGKRLQFHCRNSPTLECAVPASQNISQAKKNDMILIELSFYKGKKKS